MQEVGAEGKSRQIETWALKEKPLVPEQVEMLKPGRAALIVVDPQKSYMDPNEILAKKIAKSTTTALDEVSQRLPKFIDSAREAGVPVVWTRMIENPNFMSPNFQKKMTIEDTPPISTPDTPGFEYIGQGLDDSDPKSRIKPEEGEKEITKITYNAFTGTDLDEYLKSKGITTLVVVGAYTSRCVQATVTLAADHFGYDVFIPQDLVGMLDNDGFEQDPSLNSMGTILGYVPYSKQIMEVWESPVA